MSYTYKRINQGTSEYARDGVITNGIEGIWAVMKRRLHGVHNHACEEYLLRYVDVFIFRLNAGDVKRHSLRRLRSLVTAAIVPRITYKELMA